MTKILPIFGFFFFCTAYLALQIKGQEIPDMINPEMCKNVSHFVIDEYTCCRAKAYNSGFPLSLYWKDCSSPSENATESLVSSMWRIYSCMVTRALGEGKPLDLTNFAELMTSNYPPEIKDEILTRLNSAKDKEESLEYLEGKLDKSYWEIFKIRHAYYKAELQTCTKSNAEEAREVESESSTDSILISTSEMPQMTEAQNVEDETNECNPIVENGNMRGDCCENISIPIIPDYHTRVTTDISCISEHFAEFGEYNNEIRFNESFAQPQCSLTCLLIKMGALSNESDSPVLSSDFYNKHLFEHLIPRHFSTFVKTYVKDYVITGIRQDEMDLFKRADKNFDSLVKKEFKSFSNEFRAREFFASCEFHNVFATLVETAVYSICDGEMVFNPFGGEKLLI